MKLYQFGDLVKTTEGLFCVQCAIPFNNNTNPKYNKLGGRILYWLQDKKGDDVLYWDRELKKIFVSDDIISITKDSMVDDEE